ncbi:DoxX family protein [Bradyrhizobium genosp. P]|uniref:DoxX family protein n=1 Tax=Bradyrhizobium genosp. P TaxID=83641 RepID=UPI003CF17494
MVQSYIASVGLPTPLLAYLLAIVVEVGGGILLVVGFQARIVALVMAIFTVVCALLFQRNFADQNDMIHFLKNITMAGGLLQVFAFSAGAFSLDGRVSSRVAA